MSLSSDDSGAVFGIFLFLALVCTAGMCYAIEKPIFDEIDAAFDDDYRNKYMTAEGKDTVDTIKFIFNSVLILMVIIAGAIMVINRSIYRGEL